MNSATVKIHEFSTGIQAERTSDGGWVSRGFTGQYINKTLDSIPANVQSAIKNREFAVAEGASRDNPAIIGREVLGGDQDWSVIAVVTKGGDDRGRSASMYRYFLCEGAGNLWKILAWIYSQPQERPMPVFNPFETKVVGQPNEYQVGNPLVVPLKNELQYLLKNEAPIVIPSVQPCTAFIVNQMATEKAIENGQPVAWAFQVEALEQPRSFLVIQPASEKAEQLLHRAIASTPQYTAPITGEYEIKSAIKGLISRENVKLEQVQAIETALNQVQDSDWEVIFNAQGAAQARSQGIYSPQMVRLLTLRAIVLPETLPEFLSWMQKRGKQEDHYQVSETFQSEIKSSISGIAGNAQNFTLKITQGVKLIIPRLIEQPELLENVVWLLSFPSGLWKHIYSQQVVRDIDHDLSLMNPKVRQLPNLHSKIIHHEKWEKLANDVKVYWQDRYYPHQTQYQALAELFDKLESPKIAAFFYQIGYGEVPKRIFAEVSNGGRNSNVYGLTLKKQVSFPESLLFLLMELGGIFVPLVIVVPLILLTFMVGLLGGKALFEKTPYSLETNQSTTTSDNSKGDSFPAQTATQSPKDRTTNIVDPIPQYIEEEALKKFAETSRVMNKEVVNELVQEGLDKQQIISELKLLFQDTDLDYADAIKGGKAKETTKKEWINAIYQYQSKNPEKTLPAGYMLSEKSTVQELRKYLKKKLSNPPPQNFNTPPGGRG